MREWVGRPQSRIESSNMCEKVNIDEKMNFSINFELDIEYFLEKSDMREWWGDLTIDV